MVEERADQLIMTSSFVTLQRLISLLPQSLVYGRHRLALASSAALLTTGDFSTVERLMQAAERCAPPRLAETGDANWLDDVAGVTLVHRSMMARAQRDLPRAIALGRVALDHVPAHLWFLRAIAGWNLGMAYLPDGNLASADEAFDELWRDNSAPKQIYARIVAAFSRAHVLVVQGRLHAAVALYHATLQHGAALNAQPPAIAMLYVGLADVLYEWNDLEAAASYLSEGIKLAKQFGQLDVLAAGHAVLARVHQAQGDAAAATANVAQVDATFATGVFDRWSLPRARVWLAQGNIAAAERWATRNGIAADTPASYEHEVEQIMLARVLLQQKAFANALRLLDRLMAASEAGGRFGVLVEVLALKALAHQGSGDQAAALACLERALSLAEQQGYVRLFVDEGAPMAALLRAGVQQGVAPAYCAILLTALGANAKS